MVTTPYHIKIAPPAKQQILDMSAKYQKLIIKLAEALAVNPRPPGINKIEGMTGLYSADLNHLRLIYKVEDQEVFLLWIK